MVGASPDCDLNVPVFTVVLPLSNWAQRLSINILIKCGKKPQKHEKTVDPTSGKHQKEGQGFDGSPYMIGVLT
jgi:hypothetical protein